MERNTDSASDEGGFAVVFNNELIDHRLLVDDDGRCCYAYLIEKSGNIVGDVWVYNRHQTPIAIPWNAPRAVDSAPFLNSLPFAGPKPKYELPLTGLDLRAEWGESRSGAVKVRLLLRGILIAILEHNAKPGWSLMAAIDGPVAKVLAQTE